ncbi:hypothetical protein KM043_000978 [Ampulex compressa]|nr:hypothetical protein KM043_000978 [Ampulex compressa]
MRSRVVGHALAGGPTRGERGRKGGAAAEEPASTIPRGKPMRSPRPAAAVRRGVGREERTEMELGGRERERVDGDIAPWEKRNREKKREGEGTAAHAVATAPNLL